MDPRKGERWGWIGGWSGAFLWLLLLGAFWLLKGIWIAGTLALFLVVLAEGFIISFAPWRYPDTPYWKLLLPLYSVFGVALALAYRYGEPGAMALEGWSYFWILPILLPFYVVGTKTWNSGAMKDSPE